MIAATPRAIRYGKRCKTTARKDPKTTTQKVKDGSRQVKTLNNARKIAKHKLYNLDHGLDDDGDLRYDHVVVRVLRKIQQPIVLVLSYRQYHFHFSLPVRQRSVSRQAPSRVWRVWKRISISFSKFDPIRYGTYGSNL